MADTAPDTDVRKAEVSLPALSLVVLVGPSGSGKSTFCRRHFLPTEVVSSDRCRGMVSDDENSQEATAHAFELLHTIVSLRLARGRLTVVDATNVTPEARRPLVELSRRYHVRPVALVLDMPEALCLARNRERPDRQFGPHVVRRHLQQLRQSLRNLEREGFREVYRFRSPEELEGLSILRRRMWTDRRDERGPFDIIGDVHGCYGELHELLARLGYRIDDSGVLRHPENRRAIFLGDLVDRGPDSPGVLRLAMAATAAGTALCVPGNHDMKLLRWLRGRQVQVSHGLAQTIEQLNQEEASFRDQVATFLDSLVSHYVLDVGRLVVAHAGMREEMQGRASGAVREFALYGETTGEKDEFGLPVRHNWAAEYRGAATVVYGHTPVPQAEWLNNTLCLDTGCVFGGSLSALRYPERELVSVPARETYYHSPRFERDRGQLHRPAQQLHDDLLDLADFTGKRIIQTEWMGPVTVREENATAALEVMVRFGADPRWLIYLPPTMSPSETSAREGLLEHPGEALDYYGRHGVQQVVCEEKHMGSRAVAVLCRDEASARRRFGVPEGDSGFVYTRTGRPFFDDAELARALIHRLREAVTAAGLWQTLETDWLCLDAELMPWSAKAQGLITHQYAPVGVAARASLHQADLLLQQAGDRGLSVGDLSERVAQRRQAVEQYRRAYRRYCWPVQGLEGLRVAPFHLLAVEGRTYFDRDHLWHMETLAGLAAADPGLITATPYRLVDLEVEASRDAVIAWWEELTAAGGEGMVVKPREFMVRQGRRLLQPAIKCRGAEYLRIIYGPEYTLPENLARLRSRGLGAKRGLALREFALGAEALVRFVRGEPLRRVHECVFGVLALESEPVDPRL